MRNEITFSVPLMPSFSYNLQFIGMTLLMVKWYLSIFNLLLLTPVVCLLHSPEFRGASSPSKTLFINSASFLLFIFFSG